MNSIKTVTTITLVNFAVVVGLIYGWNLAATKNEMRVVPISHTTSSASLAVKTIATSTTEAVSNSTSSVSKNNNESPSVKPTPTPSPTPAPNPTPAPAPAPVDNRCLVTIQGKLYDVTELRVTHSGGDVFTCGVDNTDTFFKQHNQRFLDRTMPAYLAK